MNNKKNLNREELEKEYERIKKILDDALGSDNFGVSLTRIRDLLWRDRLSRLILIYIAKFGKCFLNDVITAIANKHKIKTGYPYYLRKVSKLAQFGLINIHKLMNQKDDDMLERYKELNTKCPKSRINYFEFNLNERNLKILKECMKMEGLIA